MTAEVARHDVIILGAGAAGLMCAMVAGQRGRRVLLLERAEKPGKKILISGGGRCNFTNLHTSPRQFLSANPDFCISALKRYTQHDFVRLVERHEIPYSEKKLGQLFCDTSARDIVDMLLTEAAAAQVELRLGCEVTTVTREADGFAVESSAGTFLCESLVVATGGLSIPKMGASDFGYRIAHQFGLGIVRTRPALVPFVFTAEQQAALVDLAGVALDARVRCGGGRFDEAILFTHRGISGPAILQISSYWTEGDSVAIDLFPGTDPLANLKDRKQSRPRAELKNVLAEWLPARFAERATMLWQPSKPMAELKDRDLARLAMQLKDWRIEPAGTEGYRTAEVTLGGVDTTQLSSRTMAANAVPGLFFIGEVVDVTGHLGGFNFQWAWSSGHAAGQAV